MIVNFPFKVLIEKSVKDKINNMLENMNIGRKCLIITGNSIEGEISEEIKNALPSFVVSIKVVDSVEKDYLEKVSKEVENYDFVIGIGGGRSIDAAKYSSYLAKKPWVAFPTILSHDGVVSSRASIGNDGKKASTDATEPIAIVVDLDVIKNAPHKFIASGAGDVISNLSAIQDWKIAEKAGKEEYHTVMAELALLSVASVRENISDIKEQNYHGIEMLLWALMSSGFAMNIYGSSRPCSGSEHNISHVLESLGSTALHGEQVALATILTTYLQGKDWKEIRKILEDIGLPVTAKDLGIEKDMMIKAIVQSRNVRDRYTVLNEVDLDEKKAEDALREVGII
jgi:glycerol-1-phosphate dehydrogenase [NAD(P)+]